MPDPAFGSGYVTTGSYVQVVGPSDLQEVNAALRDLVLADQARDHTQFADVAPPGNSTDVGRYSTDPAKGTVSVSSSVVSVLIPTTAIAPGGNDGGGWISGTFRIPSARPVTFTSLFADQQAGLQAVARQAQDRIVATNSCVYTAINDPDAGSGYVAGFAPTADNYRYFAVTPDALVVGFAQGAIGFEYCGSVSATVPWAQLQSVLSASALQLIKDLH